MLRAFPGDQRFLLSSAVESIGALMRLLCYD